MIETNIPCPRCGTVIDCSKMEEAIINKIIELLDKNKELEK